MAVLKQVNALSLTDSGERYFAAPKITLSGGHVVTSNKVRYGNNSLNAGVNSWTYNQTQANGNEQRELEDCSSLRETIVSSGAVVVVKRERIACSF